MKRSFLLLILFAALFSFSPQPGKTQCPVMKAALIDACGAGTDEGYNEFLAIMTGAAPLALTDLKIDYDNASTFSSPILTLNGNTAGIFTTKTGSGVISNAAGALLTTTTGPLPANTPVVVIPRNVSTNYDLSSFGPVVYVLYFDISKVAGGWLQSGNLANKGSSSLRYFRLTSTAGACTSIVSYDRASLPNGTGGDGVSWNPSTGTPGYVNSGCAIPLPLTLLSFSAQPGLYGLNLAWRTNCEASMQDFVVEKKAEGNTDFHTTAVLPARNGGCAHGANYSFTDEQFGAGLQLYRLKMMDLSGRITYSPTLRYSNGRIMNDDATGHVINNPVAGQLIVSSAEGIRYCITNIMGQALLTGYIADGPGNDARINVESLAPGTYLLQLAGQHGLRFVKQ